MHHSLDALEAFVQAAAQGSFSAAARALGKSQSSISESIANLEIDLDVQLFDRSQRQPVLTPAGGVVLDLAQQVLNANERLNRSASLLASGMESHLTLALSDTFQGGNFDDLLAQIDSRYPDLEFECIIAEHADVVDLIQRGRADLGLLAAQAAYPPDITHATLSELSEIALFVGRSHPLATCAQASLDDLAQHRELRMSPHGQAESGPLTGKCWSAPSYLMLLEMAAMGYGWTELPRWMHKRFGAEQLVELRAAGWPRMVPVDLAWSARRRLGSAGAWLLQCLLRT